MVILSMCQGYKVKFLIKMPDIFVSSFYIVIAVQFFKAKSSITIMFISFERILPYCA